LEILASRRKVSGFFFFNFCLFFLGQTLDSSQGMCVYTLVARYVCVHTQSVHEPINISLPTGGPCIYTLYLHTGAFIYIHNMFTYFIICLYTSHLVIIFSLTRSLGLAHMGSSSGHLGSSQGNLAALHFQVLGVGFRVYLEEI
jgi:hypothetical protein